MQHVDGYGFFLLHHVMRLIVRPRVRVEKEENILDPPEAPNVFLSCVNMNRMECLRWNENRKYIYAKGRVDAKKGSGSRSDMCVKSNSGYV